MESVFPGSADGDQVFHDRVNDAFSMAADDLESVL
jgi:hypothetical protein